MCFFFHLQLLISYGDVGTKGALTDEHVFASAKCQVYFFVQHLFCYVVSVFFFKKGGKIDKVFFCNKFSMEQSMHLQVFFF